MVCFKALHQYHFILGSRLAEVNSQRILLLEKYFNFAEMVKLYRFSRLVHGSSRLCVRALNQDGTCMHFFDVLQRLPISRMFFRIIAHLDSTFGGGSLAAIQNKQDST